MMKVSVVVPVYNPGDDIDDCIRSLVFEQSLPTDQYEVIFVDDGSTDATPARLDQLAAEHDHVRVEHIPNSGWPGRPRNVGIDMARGDYVYFVDNDDFLGREALERLYDEAVTDGADIVIGKVVGRGKKVPRSMFRTTRRGLSMQEGTAPLALLSPHKLFRRQLLVDHDIRFPEGRRRLEDHHFVVHAYFHADRVNVLSDYSYYYWVLRGDRSNASATQWDAAGYYANVREVLDIVEAHTEPGPLRDKLMRHWYRGKILGRVGGSGFLRREPGWRNEIYREVRAIALERFTPEAAAPLAFNLRLRAHLLREATQEALEALAAYEGGLRGTAQADTLQPTGHTCDVTVTAGFGGQAGGMRLRRQDGHVHWVAPPTLSADVTTRDTDVTEELRSARVQLVLVSAEDRTEHLVALSTQLRGGEDGDVFSPVLHGHGVIDAAVAAGGTQLRPGRWTLRTVIAMLGFSVEAPLQGPDGPVALDVAVDGTLTLAAGRGGDAEPAPTVAQRARTLLRRLAP